MSLTLFPLEELELENQKEFWDQVRQEYPDAFDLFVKWTGWDGIMVTDKDQFFYYHSDVIRNLYDFFIKGGFILNPNPQFTMGGKVYYHPQILDKEARQIHRFHQQYIQLKRAEQFLYVQGFYFLNRKANMKYVKSR